MGSLTRAIKNLSRKKVRSLLIIVALSLALTLIIVLPPSINAGKATTQQVITDLTDNARYVNSTVTVSATEIDCSLPLNLTSFVGTNGTQMKLLQPLMNSSYYSNLVSIPDVSVVVPMLKQIESKDNYPIIVMGVPVDNASLLDSYPSLLPVNITAGRNLQAGDSGVTVLEQHLATHFNVTVGGTINILGQNFKVVGVEGPEALNTTCDATMSLVDAQTITNTSCQETSFKVFVNNVDNVEVVQSRISNIYPNMQISGGLSQINSAQEIQSSIDAQLQSDQNNLNQIQNIGQVEIAIAFVAASAVILFIMLFSVRERIKEIGTLKAMGASNLTILCQFMFEGVLLSIVAAIVAIAIGMIVAPALGNLLLPRSVETGEIGSNGFSVGKNPWGYSPISVTITPETMLLGIGAAVLLGALGSLYPALKAAITRPAEAMRYD
jgi:ABC-type antimicrobial peptide transport system permease subunit